MGVLWSSIGASPAYETFVGSIELAAGILLFVPGLTTLGALVAFIAAAQIFALNMTYDVPVKLFSLHLILMSAVLLAPEARRLTNVVVLNRAAGPSAAPPLVRSRRASRVLTILQCAFGAYIVAVGLHGSTQRWTQVGGGAPKPALDGIWNVDEMSIDGVVRSPLVSDFDRWRRVVVQTATAMYFQRMDDTFSIYGARVDASAASIALTKGGTTPAGSLSFARPAPDRLLIDGEMDGRKVRTSLRLVNRDSFLLVNRGFHWIQDYPFNR
jgi:hypothetical protein